jgi:hypothetical protein
VKLRPPKRLNAVENRQEAEEDQLKRSRENHKFVLKKNNQRHSSIDIHAKSFEELCQKSTLIVDRTEFVKVGTYEIM